MTNSEDTPKTNNELTETGDRRRKDVVLLGKGELATRVAQWILDDDAHQLLAVVPVQPEPTWTSSLIGWCQDQGVRYVESGHYRDLGDVIGSSTIDLAISIFYDKLIKPDFIDSCARIINLHNGPLPRYRGVSPINWALKNEEPAHGVTIHEIFPGIDDGDIISQTTFSIHPELDEVRDVLERATEHGWQLFRSTIPLLDHIVPVAQDHASALTYMRSEDHLLGDRRNFTRAESDATAHPNEAA